MTVDIEKISSFLLWGLAFIFSTTCHEAAHAWAARKGGDLTAYLGGQLTLNPWPHIKRSPFGMVLVPTICFFLMGLMVGWASAPYDPRWARRYPHRAALMSLAGPSANILILLACLVLMKIGMASGLFFTVDGIWFLSGEPGAWETIAQLFSILFTLNLLLAVFNLIPIPPLDGAMGILLFFRERYAGTVMNKLNMFGMFGMLISWLIFNRIFPMVLEAGWWLVKM